LLLVIHAELYFRPMSAGKKGEQPEHPASAEDAGAISSAEGGPTGRGAPTHPGRTGRAAAISRA
jgi:hypothetical protein